MHYFVDGYNLLFRSMEADDELQKQRERLIQELTRRFETLHLDVTLVFDAAYTPSHTKRTRTPFVEIVYTAAGESADHYIIQELQAMPKVKQETVVTNDKRLAWQARRLDATTLSVTTFLAWLESRYRNKMRGLHKKTKTLPLNDKTPTVRVPPAKREALPSKQSSPEACLDYYQTIFEKSYAETVEEAAKKSPTKPPASAKKTEKRKKPPRCEEPAPMSEEERWLKIFTQQQLSDHPRD